MRKTREGLGFGLDLHFAVLGERETPVWVRVERSVCIGIRARVGVEVEVRVRIRYAF